MIIALLAGKVFAQHEDKIGDNLEAPDIKKIDKADVYLDDAGKLMDAAIQLYPETSTPAVAGKMPAGLIFRIQVAAARTPMTRNQLARIYPGPYAIEMVEEEGWHKYQLLGLRLYSDALAIIKDIPINGVFISAYEDGNRIGLYQGVLKNHATERSVKNFGRKNLGETEYHVQVAASKYPLEYDDLLQFYSGSEPVALILEDGWYKYHIKAGNDYGLANKVKDGCGVHNAYVIPYKRGLRVKYASRAINE